MDGEELVGVVTKLDFLHVFDFISSHTMIPDVRKIFARIAGDIMSMPIISVCLEDSTLKAAKRMRINGVRSIVVTDEKMKVIEDWRAIDVEDALKTLHTERRHYLTHVDNSRNP